MDTWRLIYDIYKVLDFYIFVSSDRPENESKRKYVAAVIEKLFYQ